MSCERPICGAGTQEIVRCRYRTAKEGRCQDTYRRSGADCICDILAFHGEDPRAGRSDDLASGIFKGATSLSPAEAVDSRSLAIDNLMQSTEGLRARKQMTYVHVETLIYEALVKRYPRHEANGLRLVAAVSVTVWRTTKDRWHQAGDDHSFESYLRKQFKSLAQAFGS